MTTTQMDLIIAEGEAFLKSTEGSFWNCIADTRESVARQIGKLKARRKKVSS